MGISQSGNLGDLFPAGVDPNKPALIIALGPAEEVVTTYAGLRDRSNAGATASPSWPPT
jgi:hypothetical protein